MLLRPAMPAARKQPPKPPQVLSPPRRRWKVFVFFIFLLGLLAAMVSYSRWRELPAAPLPRGEGVLTLGALESDFKRAFPEAPSRDFNNDPRFRVYTVKGTLPEGAKEAEVLFHKGKLFFTSLQWEDPSFHRRFEAWVKQSQAFLRRGPVESPLFNTPEGYRLVEWYLEDAGTEMTLRELATPEGSRFWRDLRDRTNTAALTDFAPYRLNLPGEGGS